MPLERILVVDDDASILRLLAIILRRERYSVDTAGGGKDALAKIELGQYNVIVLDLMMPDVSGLDVLRRLDTRFPQVKCVVILSAGSSLEIARCANPGNIATCDARPPNDMDFSCGFQSYCPSGTRSRIRRVCWSSCGMSPRASSEIVGISCELEGGR